MKSLIPRQYGWIATMNKVARTFCVWFGHSHIVSTCMGEVSCTRCRSAIGDTLAASFDLTDKVLVGHDCSECRANWLGLGWRDRLLAPRQHDVLFNAKQRLLDKLRAKEHDKLRAEDHG